MCGVKGVRAAGDSRVSPLPGDRGSSESDFIEVSCAINQLWEPSSYSGSHADERRTDQAVIKMAQGRELAMCDEIFEGNRIIPQEF